MADASTEPTLEVLENLVPAALHAAAWVECQSAKWRFGHGSTSHGAARFWMMELQGNAVFDDIWQHARAHCETITGVGLRVIRQYANGHTYGLGAAAHADDHRPGTFTLLYYANPQWSDGWDGETVFYDPSGEVVRALRPRPNRAVFFDSRIVHVGRAPSRLCPELRVTVAYKLEALPAKTVSSSRPMGGQRIDLVEVSRNGASRVYAARVPESLVDNAIEERLTKLGQNIRLPGFKLGDIPRALLKERYGAQTRHDVLKYLAVQTLESSLPTGSIVSSCELQAGAEFGDMELRVEATHLPDLPDINLSGLVLQRLCLDQGEPSPRATAHMRNCLEMQLLDQLDAYYPIPLFPKLVDREFEALWTGAPGSEAGATEADVRAMAARRLRLGVIMTELGRRFGIRAATTAELQEKVVDHLIAQAQVQDRRITQAELHEMMKS